MDQDEFFDEHDDYDDRSYVHPPDQSSRTGSDVMAYTLSALGMVSILAALWATLGAPIRQAPESPVVTVTATPTSANPPPAQTSTVTTTETSTTTSTTTTERIVTSVVAPNQPPNPYSTPAPTTEQPTASSTSP